MIPDRAARWRWVRGCMLPALGAVSACVPWVVSYYAPESPQGTVVDNRCEWPVVTRKFDVTAAVSITLQSSPRDRLAFDVLYIRITDQSVVRLEGDSILVRSPEFTEPLALTIRPAQSEFGKTAITSEVRGPAVLTVPVSDPTDRRRPANIVVELPNVVIDSKVYALPPVSYRLHRGPRLVGICT